MRGRVWVFDRGVVSEDNLQDLRQRGAYYLVGTPRRKLANFERELLEGDWQEVAGKPGVRVQLLEEAGETFVLARSLQRAKKESAMLRGQLLRLHRSLRSLRRVVASGRLKDTSKIERRLGRLEERYPQGCWMLSAIEHRVAGCCGPGIRRVCGEPSCAMRLSATHQSRFYDPDALCANTCSLPKSKPPSVPLKANWPFVRSGTVSSAASRLIS